MTAWHAILALGLATLALVDYGREQNVSWVLVYLGQLPNAVAVPVLVSVAMIVLNERTIGMEASRRWFRWAVIVAVALIVAWEFLQRWGALFFDPLDLIATGIGAAAIWRFGEWRLQAKQAEERGP
jgi:hypothetical protein